MDQDVTKVGVGPGGIVLDGNPACPTERGTAAPTFVVYGRRQVTVAVNCGSCPLSPNGWMNQDATWYGDRPRPK